MHDDGIGSKPAYRRKSFNYIFRSGIFGLSIDRDAPDVPLPPQSVSSEIQQDDTHAATIVTLALQSLNALDRSSVTHADLPFSLLLMPSSVETTVTCRR
jgi:hypothetical protein